MKHIQKGVSPTGFEAWKTQESETLERQYEDETYSANDIWGLLSSNLANDPIEGVLYYSKNQLREVLAEEQGTICCYCGQKLNLATNLPIEHLEPKSENRQLIYEYTNLLLSCKGGDVRENHQINNSEETLESLSDRLGVNKRSLRRLNRGIDWSALNIGDTIAYRGKHCDAEKNDKPIPVKPIQPDCEEKFEYSTDGTILAKSHEDSDTNRTIEVLNLNYQILKIGRKEAFDAAIKAIDDIRLMAFPIGEDTSWFKALYESLNEKRDNEFEPFCFVKRYFIKPYIS